MKRKPAGRPVPAGFFFVLLFVLEHTGAQRRRGSCLLIAAGTDCADTILRLLLGAKVNTTIGGYNACGS
jgi:hypothetical protein